MNNLMRQTQKWLDPFDLVTDLQDDINHLFSTSLRRGQPSNFSDFVPSVEIHEDENNFTLHLDAPGIDKKDMDISVTGNTVTIKGERKIEEKKKEKGYFYSERRYGSFQRSLELPTTVESDKITANYKDGVLELVVPKSEKSKPKQIKVEVK
ncbi:MAG TPA: Hsp20/alpha crystallin family protein [Candidatus Omnitrophota bacterium]|nr:Hsp20/alpha crystallin family protein [Candidatus Omnitrophota bacterium]